MCLPFCECIQHSLAKSSLLIFKLAFHSTRLRSRDFVHATMVLDRRPAIELNRSRFYAFTTRRSPNVESFSKRGRAAGSLARISACVPTLTKRTYGRACTKNGRVSSRDRGRARGSLLIARVRSREIRSDVTGPTARYG